MPVRKKAAGAKRMPRGPNYVLKVKIEGPGIHRKSIPVPELLKICEALQGAVHRQAEAMERPAAKTLRRGPITAAAQEECTLELSGIVAGSTGLLFRYSKPQATLPGAANFGSDVLAKVACTLRHFEGKREADETDIGVLDSLQQLGAAFDRKSINRISLTVPGHGRKRTVKAVYTPIIRERIAARMKAPTQERLTVEGKLEMADFKEAGKACRIHPPIGTPVQCTFDPEQEERVYAALRHPVKVSGSAKINPNTGKAQELKIEEIEVVEELMLGAKDFFASRSIAQLAEAQGVDPLKNPTELAGGWPADENVDDFVAAIDEA